MMPANFHRRGRPMRSVSYTLAIGLLAAAGSSAGQTPPDWFGVDGFEFATPPAAFRFNDLDLRDPHLFLTIPLSPPFPPLCYDFTDNAIPTTTFSFNGSIADSYNNDQDGDGFLDASSLLLLRPLRQDGAITRLDSIPGQCLAPTPTAGCAEAEGAQATAFTYATQSAGTCLPPIPGTLGSPAYSPALQTPSAPCLLTAPRDLVLDNGGVAITLIDAQIGASLSGTPATTMPLGMLRGFLRETDANQITIPNPNDPKQVIVLSSLLPGGSGNCSSRNDKDQHRGESGWWFYFNFNASSVIYTSP